MRPETARPDTIGPYRLLQEIGRGGMSVVYAAVDARSGRRVALKVLPPEFAHNTNLLERFVKEGENAVKLRHPNIIPTYEAGQAGPYRYIAMELATRGTLADWLKKEKVLPAETAIHVLRQAAEGLEYAHSLGLVHRDIKPSNIIFGEDGRAMLTDFGVAKRLDPNSTQMTIPGYAVGTPAYMSPEQARGDLDLDWRADIYSLGVVAYNMLTGKMPFEASSPFNLLRKIVDETPRPAEEANPNIHPGAAYVLHHVLAKDPNARYQSAREFVDQLALALAQPRWEGAGGMDATIPMLPTAPGSRPPRYEPAPPPPYRPAPYVPSRGAAPPPGYAPPSSKPNQSPLWVGALAGLVLLLLVAGVFWAPRLFSGFLPAAVAPPVPSLGGASASAPEDSPPLEAESTSTPQATPLPTETPGKNNDASTSAAGNAPGPPATEAPAHFSRLLQPPADALVTGGVQSFTWMRQEPLAGDEALELVFWPVQAGEEGWQEGVAPVGPLPAQDQSLWRVEVNMAAQSSLNGPDGGPGEYFWGVVRVQQQPFYRRLALESSARRFSFQPGEEGAASPTPIPTPSPRPQVERRRDAAGRFEVALPQDWQEQTRGTRSVFYAPDGVASLFFQPVDGGAADSLPTLLAQVVKLGELELLEMEAVGEGVWRTIDGVDAWSQTYQAVSIGAPVTLDLIVFMRGEQAYILGTLLVDRESERFAPVLTRALDSFHLLIQPTPTPTATPTSTATPVPTPTPAATPTPTSPPTPAIPGLITDFESFGVWRRGDQPYGTFVQSDEEVQSGRFSGRLAYNFPASAGNQNFVVFLQSLPISGQPTALTAWVYGDGQGNFFNAWVQDGAGQGWQFTFGRITHTGWQQMVAPLDVQAPWPNGKIGPDTGATQLTYPLTLLALVVDAPDGFVGDGVIYVDDLMAGDAVEVSPSSTDAGEGGGQAGATVTSPPPTAAPPSALSGRIAYGAWNPGANRAEVYVHDAATGQHIATYPYSSQPDFHPNWDRLVVNGVGGGKNNLMRYDADGNDYPISLNPEDQRPTYSSSGAQLVFTSTKQGDGRSRVYRQGDNRNPEPAETLFFGGRELFGDYAIYLDNWYIAYYGCDYWVQNSNCGIYATFGNGDQPIQVTNRTSDRPTGNLGDRILFMTNEQRDDGQGENGNWDVYIVNVDGSGLRRLTTSPARDGLATASPDGRSIAFVSDRDGYWALYVMNADGSNMRQLTPLVNGFGSGEFDWTNERVSWGR